MIKKKIPKIYWNDYFKDHLHTYVLKLLQLYRINKLKISLGGGGGS